jgi:hypothetical protein
MAAIPSRRGAEEGNGVVETKTLSMDGRLTTVREEIAQGNVSPQSLVLLFNSASDAEHAGDVETLEETLALARAVAGIAGETLQAEAERLARICEQSLAGVRERHEAADGRPRGGRTAICPECGSEVAADAVRCRRCGHRFV